MFSLRKFFAGLAEHLAEMKVCSKVLVSMKWYSSPWA